MQRAIRTTLLASAGMFMAAACTSTTSSLQAVAPALFTVQSTPDRNTLQKSAEGYLATLLADPANTEITLVSVNTSLISSGSEKMLVSLPNGKAAQFERHSSNAIAAGLNGWVGYKPSEWKSQHASSSSEIDIDPLYYLSLVREGDSVVGNVILDGQRYRLETVGTDKYALIKVDESKLPPEAEPLVVPDNRNAVSSPESPRSEHSTIRVLLVSTNTVRAADPNYRVAMAQALQDANAYMENSGVDITYEMAGFYDADYTETGDNNQLLDLQNRSHPLGASVRPVRESLRADLVTMYTTSRAYCGHGYVDATRDYAFSTVACLPSMSHELGHNLGGNHNWESGDAYGNPPYKFGYRYSATPRFRTQLSYECLDGTCPRIPYHSNPRLTYQGKALGTVAHHDVARRFNERRQIIEDFYPVPPKGEWTMLENQDRRNRLKTHAALFATYPSTEVDLRQMGTGSFWIIDTVPDGKIIRMAAVPAYCLVPHGDDRVKIGRCADEPSTWDIQVRSSGFKKLRNSATGKCLATEMNLNIPVLQACDLRSTQDWITQ